MGLYALPAAYLTKSAFTDYLCCPGYAWLKRHRPDALPVVDDAAAARARKQGIEVDELARTRFDGGVLVEPLDLATALMVTADLLANGTAILFQAAIHAEPGFVARADVLIRDGAGWRLVEVKSACSMKREHVIDAAFQVATLELAGFSVTRVSIMHLDRTYRRHGACDPEQLFAETDCTDDVRAQLAGVQSGMEMARQTLARDSDPAPCDCHRKTRSNRCPAFGLFHPEVPAAGSVYELVNLRAPKLAAVLDRGITALDDWPDDVSLTPNQQRQLDVHRAGVPWVDREGLATFLGELSFPLYFLDYETFRTPVPIYDGCWPYQQVPFQYSLHVVSPEGSMRHDEYLATEIDICPIHELAVHMAEGIGPVGSIVVWNATFERGRNTELAEALPEAAGFFLGLNERMIDLMDAVSKGYFVHPDFHGRSSIKTVLPVVAPDLSYEALPIGDGGTASEQWLSCALGEVDQQERDAIFTALREYCRLDTLAMVRVWQHLGELCRQPVPA